MSEIINHNLEIEPYILRHGLTTEQAIKSACIDLLGLENLTNSVKGHDSWKRGLKTVNGVLQHYFDATEPTIIINFTEGLCQMKNCSYQQKRKSESN